MGKFLKFTALFILVPAFIYAGGGTGADILKEKTGVRAVAMGGAYTAAADDVEALNYNPAGIAFITKKEFEFFTYPMNYAGVSVFYAAFAQSFESPLLDGFAGASLVYRGIPDIDNEAAEDAPVSYYDMALTGSYACSIYQYVKDDFFKALKTGISAKLILEQIGVHSISSLAFDAGVIYEPADMGLKFGVSLLNAGFPISAKRGDTGAALTASPLPMTLRAGLAYKVIVDKNNSTLFSADYIHDFYDAGQAAIGIEHNLLNILFLRFGYNMPVNTQSQSAFSAGVGIYIPASVPVELTVGLNYTYKLVMWNWFNAPESTHAFSMAVKF